MCVRERQVLHTHTHARSLPHTRTLFHILFNSLSHTLFLCLTNNKTWFSHTHSPTHFSHIHSFLLSHTHIFSLFHTNFSHTHIHSDTIHYSHTGFSHKESRNKRIIHWSHKHYSHKHYSQSFYASALFIHSLTRTYISHTQSHPLSFSLLQTPFSQVYTNFSYKRI